MKNIEKLLEVAKEIKAKNLPFDMGCYRADPIGESVYFYSKEDCGTMGCLLGWCPVIGKGELEVQDCDYVHGSTDEFWLSFWRYCKRVFGICFGSNVSEFLFSELWESDIDQAIERIEFVIEHGKEPTDFIAGKHEPENWRVQKNA